MLYLIIAGIVALLAGLYMLVAPAMFKGLIEIVDRVVFVLDEQVQKFRFPVGLGLVLVAAWVFYISMNPEIGAVLHPVWVIALIFGLLYLFFPKWLSALSQVANQSIFPTDNYVMGSSKVVGLFLLVAAAYIIYMAYAITKM